MHGSLAHRTLSLLRRDKKQFVRSLAKEVKGHFSVNDHCPAYQAQRKLNSKPFSQATTVHSVSGQIISDPVRVQEHWGEIFEQFYQVDPVCLCPSAVSLFFYQTKCPFLCGGSLPGRCWSVRFIQLWQRRQVCRASQGQMQFTWRAFALGQPGSRVVGVRSKCSL